MWRVLKSTLSALCAKHDYFGLWGVLRIMLSYIGIASLRTGDLIMVLLFTLDMYHSIYIERNTSDLKIYNILGTRAMRGKNDERLYVPYM